MKSVLLQDGVTRPIDVVPTGVDLSVFTRGNGQRMRQQLGIPEQAFVLGYIGRLANEKNLKFLIAALIRFLKVETRAHFLFAGRGPLEEFMQQEFVGAGLAARVHFAGMVQEQDLVDCYHALDVFVFASKSETQGMVVTEAMAVGVPVVALDAPGVRDVVRELENGRLLSHESEEEFHAALVWCMERKPQAWQALKQNARDTAALFSLERCAERALDVYKKAASELLEQAPRLNQKKWFRAIARFRTEWGIFANFGRATRKALAEMIVRDHR
jgi:glycosyltransferase involved in cell wall biosynthesis